jgi:hypothetical protein
MKTPYARITKQDDEGNFFSWVQQFECLNTLLSEILRLEDKHGEWNIGYSEITMGEYLRACKSDS